MRSPVRTDAATGNLVRSTFPADPVAGVFSLAAGCFVALGLLKFGNPVILDHKLQPPSGFWQYLIWTWPLSWAYPVLMVLALWGIWAALRTSRRRLTHRSEEGESGLDSISGTHAPPRWTRITSRVTPWLPWLPIAWLAWQGASATQSVSPSLTAATIRHFVAATACFYIGYFCLRRAAVPLFFWLPILAAVVTVIGIGFDQHFGGLEATRRYIYSQPDWRNRPAEFLQKITSNRIYSTLFYPNTLAGALILFLPATLAVIMTLPTSKSLRFILAGGIGIGGLACLYWSGSKAGWLIVLLMTLVAWLHLDVRTRLKQATLVLLVVLGLAGFFLKYSGYFQRGARSMDARLDYWKVATQIAVHHPLSGSGPGTFFSLYRYMKPPEAELARLVHNDYLQQASDSGFPGFVLYTLFVLGSVAVTYRPPISVQFATPESSNEKPLHAGLPAEDPSGWTYFALWLGLAGFWVQNVVEFGLYIPALAWPAFLWTGLLVARCSFSPSPIALSPKGSDRQSTLVLGVK